MERSRPAKIASTTIASSRSTCPVTASRARLQAIKLRSKRFATSSPSSCSRRICTSFALAGSSMGGNVAWEYALAHPEQVDALILVDASGWPDTRAEIRGRPAVFKLLRNPDARPAAARSRQHAPGSRQGLEASFADPALVTDAMVTRYVELSRAPGHRDILLQMTLGFRERNFATAERLAPLANAGADPHRRSGPPRAARARATIPRRHRRLATHHVRGHRPHPAGGSGRTSRPWRCTNSSIGITKAPRRSRRSRCHRTVARRR